MYKINRNYENLNKMIFKGYGKYEIPQIFSVHTDILFNWIPFNYALSCKDTSLCAVHFFVDDYQFLRVWNNPDRYIEVLRRFSVVCSPDFSLYCDMPQAIQLYNHYRKHWLGAYWQAKGLKVIPTIAWSDRDSFEWCFDGEPVGGIVAVSSVGIKKSQNLIDKFMFGFDKMMHTLSPEKILLYGSYIPEGYANIIEIPPFQNRFRNLEK